MSGLMSFINNFLKYVAEDFTQWFPGLSGRLLGAGFLCWIITIILSIWAAKISKKIKMRDEFLARFTRLNLHPTGGLKNELRIVCGMKGTLERKHFILHHVSIYPLCASISLVGASFFLVFVRAAFNHPDAWRVSILAAILRMFLGAITLMIVPLGIAFLYYIEFSRKESSARKLRKRWKKIREKIFCWERKQAQNSKPAQNIAIARVVDSKE